MKNQFGQEVDRGAVVAYVNKTGSFTERKIGVVLGFGERNGVGFAPAETTVRVQWVWDGSYGPPTEHLHKGTVGLRRVFKLDPASLHPYVRDGLQKAFEAATA